jgi:hypothetical protein
MELRPEQAREVEAERMGNDWQQRQEQPRRPLSATVVVLAVAGLIVLVGLGAIYLTAGSSGSDGPPRAASIGQQATMSNSMLPDYVRAAPKDTQTAYQFALDRPDVMMWVPCYCGCGGHSGHKSAHDCFVKSGSTPTNPQFDEHGAGCGVCIGIALDAKALTGQGKSLREIRSFIDNKYSVIGPATDTPLPPG